MVSRQRAKEILNIYKKAWEQQSIPLILSIFTKDGQYKERAFAKPYKNHSGIAKYWKEKVVEEQSDIKFKLLSYYVDKDTITAEWEARFHTRIEKANKHLFEVAIMKCKGDKVWRYREYWHSKTTKV